MVLHDYQNTFLDDICLKLETKSRIVAQLSTGGGKTVVFTKMIERLNGKTLVIVDSTELVDQTVKTLNKLGLDVGCVLAGNKTIPNTKVIVAMVKSLWNRRAKLPVFDYCVVDECHLWENIKLFDYLGAAKIVGFTATPTRLKRNQVFKCPQCKTYYATEQTCCGFTTDKGTIKETMSQVYEDIVVGVDIQFLIDNGFLVADENYTFEFDDSKLAVDSSGEFTSISLFETFKTEEYQASLVNAYNTICPGKKTMIFTSSTTLNAIYAQLFTNVRTYDSVNNKPSERDEIVNWFKNTPGAILINTGCFTKGFDVCDVEAIILARSTMSLALYIQMVGRGARITKKQFKDKIIVIDGGNNIKKHNTFSHPRNWEKIFKDKMYKEKVDDLIQCNNCGFINLENECQNCGSCNWEEDVIKILREPVGIKVVAVTKHKAPKPKAALIIQYCTNKIEALNMLIDCWVNWVVASGATSEQLTRAFASGEFKKKVRPAFFAAYVAIINSNLEQTVNRTFNNVWTKLLTKLMKRYEN